MVTGSIGRYRLKHEVGRGAAGSVWEAWDPQLERRVALKLFHTDLESSGALRSLEHEARAIARLKSAHIVHVYDVGCSEEQPFMVMELLEGESLEARLARHQRLPLGVVAGILQQIASGLQQTHEAGIIHGDVKPANVFLAREARGEVAKLLDFGVARLTRPPSGVPAAPASPTRWAGTPSYISPEQFEGEVGDYLSDLWSLAVMAYRMLTGGLPFHADDLQTLANSVRAADFEPPSLRVPGLGVKVDAFFARALCKAPSKRPQTAADFASQLGGLLAPRERRPMRLLVLDDEPDMELLLRQRFRHQIREGRYELYFAADGAAGLEELRQHPDIDVVCTDLNMPGMDGLSFLEQVPRVNPFVRVIVLSAYGDMANIRAAMNRGAFDFVGKPIDFEDLQATLEKSFEHVTAVREALQSAEENQLLKLLFGKGIAERWMESLRVSGAIAESVTAATVLFVDIYGFSRSVEERPVASVFRQLNDYFDVFVRELHAQRGTVHRFVGDAVLAVFEGDDHLRRALDAALAIRNRILVCQATLLSDVTPSTGVCIGVDTGFVLAGSAGSMALGHVEPALLGQAIGSAVRLQGLAQRNEILTSRKVRDHAPPEYRYEENGHRLIPDAALSGAHRLVGTGSPVAYSISDATSSADPT